jgi:hypothetical protein
MLLLLLGAVNVPSGGTPLAAKRRPTRFGAPTARASSGIHEVDDGTWLVGFMHDDLGYIDLEQRTLQTIDNPFGTRLSPMS